jgi:hypothetical protein
VRRRHLHPLSSRNKLCMCTREGHVFDILAIVPYVKLHGTNPCTGAKLALADLIRLTYHRNASGCMHCPVTFKEFTRHSHIVAIATSGNVCASVAPCHLLLSPDCCAVNRYSWDAVEELNIKARNFTDLLTAQPFTRADIITLQVACDMARDQQRLSLANSSGPHRHDQARNRQLRPHRARDEQCW